MIKRDSKERISSYFHDESLQLDSRNMKFNFSNEKMRETISYRRNLLGMNEWEILPIISIMY